MSLIRSNQTVEFFKEVTPSSEPFIFVKVKMSFCIVTGTIGKGRQRRFGMKRFVDNDLPVLLQSAEYLFHRSINTGWSDFIKR